jgi:hypothetical protein
VGGVNEEQEHLAVGRVSGGEAEEVPRVVGRDEHDVGWGMVGHEPVQSSGAAGEGARRS